jgi:hypothetical protein
MNNNTMIAGFRTVQTSRGTVTTTEDAQLQLVRACARIGARHALGYPPNEADAYDRDALAAALGTVLGASARAVLASMTRDITVLTGGYIATYCRERLAGTDPQLEPTRSGG